MEASFWAEKEILTQHKRTSDSFDPGSVAVHHATHGPSCLVLHIFSHNVKTTIGVDFLKMLCFLSFGSDLGCKNRFFGLTGSLTHAKEII